MGVGDVPAVPSLALGSGEVTLQSMTAAYAAFDNHGLVPRPILIRRVEDRDGVVLFEDHDESTRAISETTAFLMTNMLVDVVAVLVLVLMAADVFRMLVLDAEPQRDPVRRDDS